MNNSRYFIEYDNIRKVYHAGMPSVGSRSFNTYAQAKSHLRRCRKKVDGIKKPRMKMISPVKQRHTTTIEQDRYFDRIGCE